MTHTSSSLHRFLNNCTIILASLGLTALIIIVIIGMCVHIAKLPTTLGNSPANIDNIKAIIDPNEFTFVVVGDTKSGTATFEAMLDVIHQDRPAFAVILGDFVCHPERTSHKLFALEMTEHTKVLPIFVIPGNHDISTDGPFRLKDFENSYLFVNNFTPPKETTAKMKVGQKLPC